MNGDLPGEDVQIAGVSIDKVCDFCESIPRFYLADALKFVEDIDKEHKLGYTRAIRLARCVVRKVHRHNSVALEMGDYFNLVDPEFADKGVDYLAGRGLVFEEKYQNLFKNLQL